MIHSDFAIEITDLHVSYKQKGKRFKAVRGLSLSVKPGEVVGFLGPNGAGKSSTLKALLGFVTPASGTCQIFGQAAGTIEAKAQIGYLPEVATYYPYLTPRETLKLYGGLQGLGGTALDTEINELLEKLDLSEAANKLNKTMSKGMLQRVGIAQALLGSPKLLILDEVTSGLDPIGRLNLRGLIRERVEGGATVFFSSHELSEVDQLCDRILLINKGQLVEEHAVGQLRSSTGKYHIITKQGQDLAFTSKEALIQHIQSSPNDIADIVASPGELEDYFVKTIKEAA